MSFKKRNSNFVTSRRSIGVVAAILLLALVCPFNIFSVNPNKPVKPVRRTTSPVAEWPDTIGLSAPVGQGAEVVGSDIWMAGDTLRSMPVDTLNIVMPDEVKIFNPDPTRAVWLSALFPGLGQIYNRRYWKLPVIIGGFMGLGYATSWNNSMLSDYTRAYSDLLDSDPTTKSYMDFFPPTTQESDLDKTWLQRVMKSRKDYYRRNRDLCIICMVGVYLLAMVDAYVDAQLSHFDISPSLSMDVAPAIIPDARNTRPGVGMQWALNF